MWDVEPGPRNHDGLEKRVMDWYQSVRASHAAAFEEVKSAYGGIIPRIASLPELAQDVDGLAALEMLREKL
jgi:hypothetical protein